MGQHKYNQTAIDAKNGKLKPKKRGLSKRERDRMLYAKCKEVLYKPFADAYDKMDKYA